MSSVRAGGARVGRHRRRQGDATAASGGSSIYAGARARGGRRRPAPRTSRAARRRRRRPREEARATGRRRSPRPADGDALRRARTPHAVEKARSEPPRLRRRRDGGDGDGARARGFKAAAAANSPAARVVDRRPRRGESARLAAATCRRASRRAPSATRRGGGGGRRRRDRPMSASDALLEQRAGGAPSRAVLEPPTPASSRASARRSEIVAGWTASMLQPSWLERSLLRHRRRGSPCTATAAGRRSSTSHSMYSSVRAQLDEQPVAARRKWRGRRPRAHFRELADREVAKEEEADRRPHAPRASTQWSSWSAGSAAVARRNQEAGDPDGAAQLRAAGGDDDRRVRRRSTRACLASILRKMRPNKEAREGSARRAPNARRAPPAPMWSACVIGMGMYGWRTARPRSNGSLPFSSRSSTTALHHVTESIVVALRTNDHLAQRLHSGVRAEDPFADPLVALRPPPLRRRGCAPPRSTFSRSEGPRPSVATCFATTKSPVAGVPAAPPRHADPGRRRLLSRDGT